MFITLCIQGCCRAFPDKIERYIRVNHNIANDDTCYINLKDVVMDYDTLFCFKSTISIDVVRDIIQISEYKNDGREILGNIEEEFLYIILIKNGSVVYENEYNYTLYNAQFVYSELVTIPVNNYHEENAIRNKAYETSDSIFLVNRTNGEYYIRPVNYIDNQ